MIFLVKANEIINTLYTMNLKDIYTLENLNNAFYQGSKISHWKDSTQRYKTNLLLNNIQLREELLNGEYRVSPTMNFVLRERGKIRNIEAPNQRDRVVQKVLCKKVLVPQLTRNLIYDNYASLKDRGTTFARKRIDVLLKRYINHYNDGYVLQIDIKRYFESIDHQTLKEMVRQRIHEGEDVMKLIDYIIDTSSHSNVGLNLGSEAPQILAIYYLSGLDNYIKTILKVKYYGRYMDDMFIISNDKEELKEILDKIKYQLSLIKLKINEKKTHIVKLSHGFTYMQIKYSIDGKKIIKRPTRAKIVRERRRLKKLKNQYDKGNMTEYDIHNCYKSWRNNVIKDCNCCYKSINKMDNIYASLFPDSESYIKNNRNKIINNLYKEKENTKYEIHSSY